MEIVQGQSHPVQGAFKCQVFLVEGATDGAATLVGGAWDFFDGFKVARFRIQIAPGNGLANIGGTVRAIHSGVEQAAHQGGDADAEDMKGAD